MSFILKWKVNKKFLIFSLLTKGNQIRTLYIIFHHIMNVKCSGLNWLICSYQFMRFQWKLSWSNFLPDYLFFFLTLNTEFILIFSKSFFKLLYTSIYDLNKNVNFRCHNFLWLYINIWWKKLEIKINANYKKKLYLFLLSMLKISWKLSKKWLDKN